MLAAPIPENDHDRLASLSRMQLLSTPREADLDRIVRVAQKHFHTKMALISLLDRDRQWFKAKCGLDASETDRSISLCGHAILGDKPFIVDNALEDPRFSDNPLVTGPPHIRFYAGQPLTNQEGFKIGTLCVISTQPRQMTSEEQETLQDMGRLAEIVLENRRLSETQLSMLTALEEAEREALIDPLTGVWNRRGFSDLIDREISRAKRSKSPLAVCLADIDHFKKINDTYGHPTGDTVIKTIAELLVENVRGIDTVARFGGEEFVIILPGVHAVSLPQVAEKILRAVRTRGKLDCPDGAHAVTISLGLTITGEGGETPATADILIEHADKALYQAKHEGRNRYKIIGVPDAFYTHAALS
jgi:diguanylate cyclase (GGDEF)-like protein